MAILRGGLINVQTAGTGGGGGSTGVTTIEGLSGIVDLDSPNNSIDITTSGQIIFLNALYTPLSGAIVDQKCADILTLSGLIDTVNNGVVSIEGLSGVVDIDSLNDGITISTSGQVIQLNPLFSSLSGQIIDQKCQDIVTLSGITDGLPRTQTTINGLSGQVNLVSANSGALNITQVGQTLTLTALYTPLSGAIIDQKCEDIVSLSGSINNIVSDAGQTSVEGVSGVIDLDSPNSSINIGVAGQTINLEAIFTWASGQLLESLVIGSGVRSINGISGIVDLVSENNGLTVTNDGQVIRLTSLFTGASGSIIDQKCEDILTLSGLIDNLDLDTQTSINGISGQVFISGINNEVTVSGQTILVSGYMNAASGAILEQKCRDIDILSGLINTVDTDTQTTLNGLSGQVFLSGVNLEVTTSGQTILVSGIMNASSGAIIDQKCADILTLSGLINTIDTDTQMTLNGLSGQVFISGVNNEITTSGQTILVSGHMNAASGAILDQKCRDIDTLSGLINTIDTDTQMTLNGLSGQVFLSGVNLEVTTSGQTILVSGLMNATSGAIIDQKCADILTLSGLVDNIVPDAGQTSTNGISGVTFISGINNEVTVSGQTILVSGIMNASSGAIIDQKCADILTLSGLIDNIVPDAGQTSINGISGVTFISGINNEVTVSGQTILVSGFMNAASGAILEQKCRDIDILSGLINTIDTDTQMSLNGLSGQVFISGINLEVTTSGQTILVSGIMNATSGAIIDQKCADILTLSGIATQNSVDIITLSGLIGTTDTQTSVNGLSGQLFVSGINLEVTTSGQTILVSGLYNATSGAIIDQKCQDITDLSGLIDNIISDGGQTSINGISGIIFVSGVNNEVTVSGQTILVSGYMNAASGAILEQKCEDVTAISGTVSALPRKAALGFNEASGAIFVLEHGLQTEDFVWSMWQIATGDYKFTMPDNIYPSGSNHAVVELSKPMDGRVVFVG